MTGEFEVRYTSDARDDLLGLFDFLLDRAKTVEDFDDAQLANDAITIGVEGHLTRSPFIYRKVGESPYQRELIIPFRASGYVVLYAFQPPGDRGMPGRSFRVVPMRRRTLAPIGA